MNPIRSTQQFLNVLHKENELKVIDDLVDPYLELAEIQRRVVGKKGPALLFRNIKGSQFPVATNLYGSEKRIHLAFGEKPVATIQRLAKLAKDIFPPSFGKFWKERSLALLPFQVGLRSVRRAPITDIQMPGTASLPKLVSWERDGGPFVTLPLVHTQSPKNQKSNLGMYRVQIFDEKTVGMHIQIHRGGGFHYYEAEREGHSLPAHVYVGGPPALTIAAVAPLPEEIPEFVFASFLMGEKLRMHNNPSLSPYPIVADADFAILGFIPPYKRKLEGPFGDHYGYYSLEHEYPYLDVTKVLARKDAVWAATVVGRPPQEDHYIAEFLQDLLSPIFPLVMPQVVDVWAYEESGVHSLAAAIVKERYFREAFMGALRILGEGQLSLTKCLLVTNQRVRLKDFSETFRSIVENCDPRTDLFVFSQISQDTLDYTSGTVNKGSKMLFLGIKEEGKGPKFPNLATQFNHSFKDSRFRKPKVFMKGVLVVEGPNYQKEDRVAEILLQEELSGFHFVFLVNDSEDACKSDHDFIWTMFTRMEPGSDVYAHTNLVKNQVSFEPPLVFDCRMKPWIPDVLEVDPKTKKQVEERFGTWIDSLATD
ncbi:3-polyprenyl-4-hydroxybenzoate decarboxylase [Leptospira ryugenii]|uniref:3-polyprenyl-4-hydroxybenzoate decarboxylase n=1 Tax=Leptospira ryugenii TaxID=1917863 RepID=A0A2P2DW55_9LEPT|nr:UbiD family decarboxylase [Leptospira ryugenii]GBF48868.1 3-polyprenyl-4-hydroxybenzoate decarboxylase [Leptospira ryugenii]